MNDSVTYPMAFTIIHRYGETERNPPFAMLPMLYAELAASDGEHVGVGVTHESEWSLAAGADGSLVFENLEQGEPRHMLRVSREKIFELWVKLALGDLDAVEAEPWKPGYPH